MNANEFLIKLKERIGGDITSFEPASDGGEMAVTDRQKLRACYKNYGLSVYFAEAGRISFEINVKTPHALLLRPENTVSRLLDKISLSAEVKIGDGDFDSKYIIQNVSAELAKKAITGECKKLIAALAPFIELEMTQMQFKMLKSADIEKNYDDISALSDLDNLIELTRAMTDEK